MKRLMAIILALALAGAFVATPAPASAAPADTEASAYTCYWYTVRRGDTLLKLADRFNTTVQAIMRANGMRSTRIYTGTKICIPRYTSGGTSGGSWYAEYWNNTSQSGPQALIRTQSQVSVNWGFGSPDLYRVQPDYFSGRFTRQIYLNPGTYRFTVRSDDGVRLWVNGAPVIDQWGFVGNGQWSVDVPVHGWTPIRIDYVEQTGLALIEFSYYSLGGGPPPPPPPPPCGYYGCPPPPGHGNWGGPWSAAFFNNRDLAGAPAFVTTYPKIDFNWGYGSPSPAVQPDNFSGRFQCWCNFGGGTYRLVAKVDDGVRVWVDGNKVIDQWREQSANYFTSVDLPLAAGPHNIIVEYMEVSANALITVYWLDLPAGTR